MKTDIKTEVSYILSLLLTEKEAEDMIAGVHADQQIIGRDKKSGRIRTCITTKGFLLDIEHYPKEKPCSIFVEEDHIRVNITEEVLNIALRFKSYCFQDGENKFIIAVY
ncbi:MAG TPA: hypothetical protein PKZ16_03430 [bacterium]|nr:hypothetical protein [bacterium]